LFGQAIRNEGYWVVALTAFAKHLPVAPLAKDCQAEDALGQRNRPFVASDRLSCIELALAGQRRNPGDKTVLEMLRTANGKDFAQMSHRDGEETAHEAERLLTEACNICNRLVPRQDRKKA
jgi:hypothetical protein